MNIYQTIHNLLPVHLQDNKEMLKIFNIFCELYNETYEYSEDTINTLLVNKLYEKFESSKEQRYSVARQKIMKSFLNEFFNVVELAQHDDKMFNKMKSIYEKLGLPMQTIDYIEALMNVLKDENIIALKSFNYLKGKLSGYLYVFDLMEKTKIQGINLDGFLRLLEGSEKNPKEPFYYRVETSMYREVYNALVHPLVHPIGFGYAVSTILEFFLEDFFSSGVRSKLLELKIKCLLEDGTYEEFDLMEMYNIESFFETELNNKKRFSVTFTTKEEPIETRKIISNYDNSIVEYSLDNLKLYDVSLRSDLDGVLNVEYDNEGNLVKATYNQFFINRKKFTSIYWRIKGDLDNTLYTTDIKIDINSLKKVPDTTYVEGIDITPEMLMELTRDEILGSTYKVWSRSCGLEYKIQYEYYSTMSDDLRFVVYKTMWEFWNRRMPLDKGKYYVSAYNYRSHPKFWQPVIDEFYFGNDAPSIYNWDYRNHPHLPEINDLGWDSSKWIFEIRPYDIQVPNVYNSEQRSSAHFYNAAAEFYPAWESFWDIQQHDVSGWNITCPERVCLIGGHDYKERHILHEIGEPKKFIGICNQIPCRWERGDKFPTIREDLNEPSINSEATLTDDNTQEKFLVPINMVWIFSAFEFLDKMFPHLSDETKHTQISKFKGTRDEKIRCFIGGHIHENEYRPEHYHIHKVGEKDKVIGHCMCSYTIEGDAFKSLLDILDDFDVGVERSGQNEDFIDRYNKPITDGTSSIFSYAALSDNYYIRSTPKEQFDILIE